MATILSFKPSVRSGAAMTIARAAGISAEIVFFPGVRYERWAHEPPMPAAAKPQRRTKRRDKLELDD